LVDTILTDSPPPAPIGLADRLKHATHRLHREAERSGFIRDLLNHRGTLPGYVLFLRNLLPVYEALEDGLGAQASAGRPLAKLARPELYRSAALRSDLAQVAGADWQSKVPVLDAASAYAERVRQASSADDGAGLAGHAYVRYLGDLNGGQILARLLARDLALPETALSFYAFPAFADLQAAATAYRNDLDRLGAAPGLDLAAVEAEAIASFEGAIALSKAVAAHA
jgi:heme oxygenase